MTSEIEEQVNIAIEFFPGRVKRDEWTKQAEDGRSGTKKTTSSMFGKIKSDSHSLKLCEIEIEWRD